MQQIYNSNYKLGDLIRTPNLKNCLFNPSEIKFIDAFLDYFRPLAETLDIFQGEKHIFYLYIYLFYINFIGLSLKHNTI